MKRRGLIMPFKGELPGSGAKVYAQKIESLMRFENRRPNTAGKIVH
jgi:hypothetical protein